MCAGGGRRVSEAPGGRARREGACLLGVVLLHGVGLAWGESWVSLCGDVRGEWGGVGWGTLTCERGIAVVGGVERRHRADRGLGGREQPAREGGCGAPGDGSG